MQGRSFIRNKTKQKVEAGTPSDSVVFWSVRWFYLRLIFSSGVVKLTSGYPTWWNLYGKRIKIYLTFESISITLNYNELSANLIPFNNVWRKLI